MLSKYFKINEDDHNQINLIGKFGKRLVIERNLGNNCLMIYGRHIKREAIVLFTNWLIDTWQITTEELKTKPVELNYKEAERSTKGVF